MSFEDKELDELIEQRQEKQLAVKEETKLDESAYVAQSMQTEFAKRMDDVKQTVLETASNEDESFRKQIKENVKEAAIVLTKVEKDKAEYTEQQVEYESEKLTTKQQKELHTQQEDKWSNRQKRREYHYNGVKPLMTFAGIDEPMNLALMYFFTLILIPFFFLAKVWACTIGALLTGAQDKDRSKTAKAFIWTVIALVIAFAAFAIVYLFLEWRGIKIF